MIWSEKHMKSFNTIEEAIEDIKAGKMIIVVDDENRENEGDLVMAAEKSNPENVNFMIKNARGLICVPMEESRLNELDIKQMVENNTDKKQTAFTVSVDSINTSTGISAKDRAETIYALSDSKSTKDTFNRPGHIFPLEAKQGGVLKRAGHTEAAVDLAKLAGLSPIGVICEIMNDDGTMSKVPELIEYSKKHNLKMISIEDLIAYRSKKETLVEKISEATLDTKHGQFSIVGFINKLNGEHHIALVKGQIDDSEPVLVRVHSECLTGDALGSLRCDCGEQLNEAMRRVQEKGKGIILYMRQEGRGIGLLNKIKAYHLQDKGMDTVEANVALGFKEDLRDYGIGAQMLAALGAKKIILMTNNPSKIKGLSGYGIDIVDRSEIQVNHNEKNEHYLKTKKAKMGHFLDFKESE
jgi:3,4-dihydroxy 2-butanone 4-phosphate synthase/GTP cyclohydrolase II